MAAIFRCAAEFTAPSAAKPGRLFITADVNSGVHIYSLTQARPNDEGPLPSKINLTLPAGVEVGTFQSSPPPKKGKEKEASATWSSKPTKAR